MAIYKGREVTFISPVRSSHQMEHATVRYANGMQENVIINEIQFTESEKKQLLKDYPSRFESVNVLPEAPKKK